MTDKIRVAILDDHQPIIDGYLYRLSSDPGIEVVGTVTWGDELEPFLAQHSVDVLLLDVFVPTNQGNSDPYPILHLIPKLLKSYPEMNILVISMHDQRTLIHAVLEAGASGYVLKDDQMTIRDLAATVRRVAEGEIHLSQHAYQQLQKLSTNDLKTPLTRRQVEVLSLCAARPDASTNDLAQALCIEPSTLRNLLSASYLKLEVRTRSGAVAKARQMGLITPEIPPLDLAKL